MGIFFSFIHVQIQNDRCRKAKDKRSHIVIFSSFLDSKQTQRYFCMFSPYKSLSSLWLFLKLKSDILFVMSPCCLAVTSPQCLHSRYYFWLSLLHLGAQWSLFHFLCHNAIAQISLQGITLLETRITYVVSQTHPSSPLSHWCRWPVSLPVPRAEDEVERQEEEESVLETCHIDYHSSPEWRRK